MEEKVSTARVALKYGVLGSVVIMVYTAIINMSGLSDNKFLAMLSFIFMIIIMVMGMKEYRQQNKGFMSYGDGLGLGTLLAAVMGLLVSMFNMFYMRFIDPDMLSEGLEKVRSGMEEKGMDDAQIDQAMEYSQMFMSPGIMFAMGIFGYVFMGFIISLVLAAVLRRDKPVFE